MAESVLIVNGATRINGNTDILVGKIIEGAEGAGLNSTLVELRNKHVSDCIGCYLCREESKCSFQDDMTEIRNFINESELLIFASPLYWCGVTGLMKTFLDRLFFYYHPQNRPLISGKKAIIIT
jgi:multimeric flavodoxin WrbA